MKHEWRKKEKNFYLPKNRPEKVDIPEFRFFTIEGKGNPNDNFFSEYIELLFSLSYFVRMSPRKGLEPRGYYEYTVYPLEGIWDLSEDAKKSFDGNIDKNKLIFKLRIRQPDFVDENFFSLIFEHVKENKAKSLLDKVNFEKIKNGNCIQMMHLGGYDNEAETFQIMEDFAQQENLYRLNKAHREIYLNDARKTAPEKLKTVLRFQVKDR